MIRTILFLAFFYAFMPQVMAYASYLESVEQKYRVYRHNVDVVSKSPAMRLPVKSK